MDINRAEMGYQDGYKEGYEWLTKGAQYNNFKHPSEPKGYVPGGPYVFTNSNPHGKDAEKWNAIARISRKYHDDWMRGWVDGINKYVSDNKLNFPKVEHVR